jgi:outer membrane lipoprotein LolB
MPWCARAAWVVTACLGACAVPRPDAASGAGWSSGRISVNVEATPTQAAQGMSAAFDLLGTGDTGELRLHSPLGTHLATARWSLGLAVLVMADGERTFASLDELARHALGEALPLAALPSWISGRPWGGAPHEGTPEGFEQLGWQVALTHRNQGRIAATRSAPPAVKVRIQLDDPPP